MKKTKPKVVRNLRVHDMFEGVGSPLHITYLQAVEKDKRLPHDKELLLREIVEVVDNWVHNSQISLHLRDLFIDKLSKYNVTLKIHEQD